MKYLSEFRDQKIISSLIQELEHTVASPLRIMEVCGTHTMAIFRHGLRSILPEEVVLVSGPGCPVCVTDTSHIDAFVDVAQTSGVRVAIFGDLYRVPGSHGSLAQAQAEGATVNIVYSPMDALSLAMDHPDELLVFLSVGFETTTPLVAATIGEAKRLEVENFAVFSAHKVMPPALDALLGDPDLVLDGLLCPGHVSTIIGADAYLPLAEKFALSCVVAGFEPVDVIQAILMLIRQVTEKRSEVENAYARAVTREGNLRARKMMDDVFQPVDCRWRGLGMIPASGMAIRQEFARFDAQKRLQIVLKDTDEPKGCLCGEILKGKNSPDECPLFATRCTPLTAVGPCMVSSEGTCAAFYRFGAENNSDM